MEKRAIGVIFGSRSVEHEISIITGHQVMDAIDKYKYNVVPIYISKAGEWFTGNYLLDINNFKDLFKIKQNSIRLEILLNHQNGKLEFKTYRSFLKRDILSIDIAFVATHGTYGEDGTLQGLLEMINVPYVSSGVLASSIGMDKILMKDIFSYYGLPATKYIWILRSDWNLDEENSLKFIEEKLKYPMFVKPANLGSSVGINKAKNREELVQSINIATFYDRKIIIEESIENAREINCAVLGNDSPIASVCDEPINWKEFLDYDSKYLSGGKGIFDNQTYNHKVPADLPEETVRKIQSLAIQAFKAIDCRGIARVDFLIDPLTNKININEINTIPGAFAFYSWRPLGITFTQLVENLINLAIEAFEDKKKNITSIDSKVLLQDFRKNNKLSKNEETI